MAQQVVPEESKSPDQGAEPRLKVALKQPLEAPAAPLADKRGADL